MFDGGFVVKTVHAPILQRLARLDVENHHQQQSHRRNSLWQCRPWLQQLGAVRRPRQCHPARAGRSQDADAKLARVGSAASDPFGSQTTHAAPLNRRITITVLTHEAEERLLSKNKREVPIEQLLPEKQDNPAPEKQP